MLKILRKKGVAKRICGGIVILIIVAFGFAGKAYLLNGRGKNQFNYAGKIFGKKISFDQYKKAYKAVNIQALIQYGDNLDKLRPFLNLEREAWDRLILLHEAKKAKITVSDEEVIETIAQYPFFQQDGQFNNKIYTRILRGYFHIKPRDFEESVRETIMMAKLYEQKTAGISVSEKEIFNNYKLRNEKVQVSYVFVPIDKFIDKAVFNEKKAKEYFNSHKEEFKVPLMVDVKYITLKFPAPSKKNKNKSEKKSNKNEKQQNDKEKIIEKAKQIYQQLILTPSLKDIAKKNGIEMHTTGFFSMEKPNLKPGWSYKILNKVFQMRPGDIMEPFETPKGICIIQLRARKKSHLPNYEEVKEKVRNTILKLEAKKIARQTAEQYLKSIKAEMNKTQLKDFAKTAKKLGLELHKTPIFTRGQYLPTIGISSNFQKAAFSLTKNHPISGVVETAKGFCILYLEKYIPVDMDKYTKERNKLSKRLLMQRKNEAFNEYIKDIRSKAKLKDNIAEMEKRQKTNNP